jgi:hypothetical protein
MNSKEYQRLMEAYVEVYNKEELSEAPFTWDPNKNVIAAKGGKLGIMTKGDPKSWREPSYQEKGEIPLSSTKSFEKSPAGQKFIQQKAAAKAAKLPSTTPTARPAAPQPKPAPTTSGYKKDTSITDMIGRSQVRQGAPINTGDRSSDIRAMAARGTDFGGSGSSVPKPAPTSTNKARGSSKPGSVYSGFDMFDFIKGHLLDEGYANDEKSALAIMANMSESWKQSILEMDDFAAGGGNAKMKATGMTKDQVISLGKKNLAAKPSSSSSSSGKSSGSTSSDAVRDRLASRDKYRDTVNQASAAGVRGPVGLLRKQAAQDQEAKFNAYYDKQRNDPYYKIKSFKDIPGTFKNG